MEQRISGWIKAGGKVLAFGLDEKEANAFLPDKVSMKKEEHIAAFFEPPGMDSMLAGVGPADVHNRDPRVLPLVKGGADRPLKNANLLRLADTVKVIGNGVLAEGAGSRVVFSQLAPWRFDHRKQMNLKRTFRRTAFLASRLLANMGVSMETPLLAHFRRPVSNRHEKRWLAGLYLDTPEEWDYPYRFFRW